MEGRGSRPRCLAAGRDAEPHCPDVGRLRAFGQKSSKMPCMTSEPGAAEVEARGAGGAGGPIGALRSRLRAVPFRVAAGARAACGLANPRPEAGTGGRGACAAARWTGMVLRLWSWW